MKESHRRAIEQQLHLARALASAMDKAVRDSAANNVWPYSSYRVYLRRYEALADSVELIQPITVPIDRIALSNVPSIGDTVSIQQQEYFEVARANTSILVAFLESLVDYMPAKRDEIADLLQTRLRRMMLESPGNERDVQNVVEQLLIGQGYDKGSTYDREVGRVKVSAKETIPDFILQELEMALEVKFLKSGGRLSDLVDEINADIQAYSKGYARLVFLVYDIGGVIRDEAELRRDIDNGATIRLIVVKH